MSQSDLWNNARLSGQISFLLEIDKLKNVLRKTFLIDKSRLENTAEHSWHVSLMAIVLLEHANDRSLDLNRVIRMLLLHDLVEIDAGDTFAYDTQGYLDKEERENAAARRLFGLLPEDQRGEWMDLWREFEDGITYESKYAAALDRLQPVIHNYYTGGVSWQKNGIVKSQVLKRLAPVKEVSDTLWIFTLGVLQRSVEQGILLGDPAAEEG
ncbi:HD domain-containing protein [Cohnella silvisoli]|uniref:HD domain-containing protein n=1 Tax=Cohnella silvisoli TaxID=2873699 RepID=A0ABV1KXX3_9BACL|nr:HD domain-containing protein [Cohnella silvisoli]MCD9021872.1 HD domain-containing protein [Cohnella silvisoli]